jgi:hypothetical protein
MQSVFFYLVMSALQGILNGIVFCLNPATYALWQEWRNKPDIPFSPRSSRHNRGSFDDSAPWLKLISKVELMRCTSPTNREYQQNGRTFVYQWLDVVLSLLFVISKFFLGMPKKCTFSTPCFSVRRFPCTIVTNVKILDLGIS